MTRELHAVVSGPGRRIRFRRDHRWAPARMSDHLDDELVTRSSRRLARHLDECEECRELLASLRQLLDALARAGRTEASEPVPAIAAAVRSRLHEHP